MKEELDVVAALIQRADTMLLCQRHEDDCFGGFWEFPGGVCEANETFAEAIVREMEEELGIQVVASNLVGTFMDENESLRIIVRLFECEIVAGEPMRKECQDLGFFTQTQAAQLNLAPVDKKIFSALYPFV